MTEVIVHGTEVIVHGVTLFPARSRARKLFLYVQVRPCTMTSIYTCRWSAAKALGSPTVYPNYGDIQGAWASGNITNHEFIEVSLSVMVQVGSTISIGLFRVAAW